MSFPHSYHNYSRAQAYQAGHHSCGIALQFAALNLGLRCNVTCVTKICVKHMVHAGAIMVVELARRSY